MARAMIQAFTAQEETTLFGRWYQRGEEAYLVQRDEIDYVATFQGQGGPWGWGGFLAADIEDHYRPATDADWMR